MRRFKGVKGLFRSSRHDQDPQTTPVQGASSAADVSVTSKPPEPVTKCSPLWESALQKVTVKPEWPKFCQILQREQDTFVNAAIPPHDDAALSSGQHVTSPLTADEIARAAQTVKAIAASNPSLWSQKFAQLCTIINKTQTVGNTLTALNPYAALAWGLVGFVAGAITNNATIRQSCWDGLISIDAVLQRSKILERICIDLENHNKTSAADLDHDMIELFASIIHYQVVVVVQKYSKSQQFKNLWQPVSESQPQQILNDIKAKEDDLLKLHSLLKGQTSANHFHELLNSSKNALSSIESRFDHLEQEQLEIKKNSSYLVHYATRQERNNILQWISSIPYGEVHERMSSSVSSCSAAWLMNHPSFLSWRTSLSDNVFWLYGSMGCGKSYLTHAVIEHLKPEKPDAEPKVSFYYCDNRNLNTREQMSHEVNILQVLVKQIAHSHSAEAVPKIVDELYRAKGSSVPLNKEDCLRVIKNLVAVAQTVIVIDGLDECPSRIRNALIQDLYVLGTDLGGALKLFVASRDEVAIRSLMKNKISNQVDVTQHNDGPIRQYIEATVRDSSASEELKHCYQDRGLNLTQTVIRTLEQHANGMFRWVALGFDWLHESKSIDDMQDRLDELPGLTDLFDLYEKIYIEMLETSTERTLKAVHTLLLILMYHPWQLEPYFFPTMIEDIVEMCTFAAGNRADLRHATYLVEDLGRMCPSLVQIANQYYFTGNSMLYIPHSSVVQFLQSKHEGLYNEKNGNAYLAELCLDHFFNPNFEERVKRHPHLHQYTGSFCVYHLQKATFYGKLDEQSTFALKIQKFLAASPAPPAFLLWHNSEALSQHSQGLFRSNPPSTMPARMCLDLHWRDNSFPEELLNAKSMDVGHFDLHNVSLLEIAAAIGSTSIIQWLLDRGLDINEKHFCTKQGCTWSGANVGHTMIALASEPSIVLTRGNSEIDFPEIFKILISRGLDLRDQLQKNVLFTFEQFPKMWNPALIPVLEAGGVNLTPFTSAEETLLEVALQSLSLSTEGSRSFVKDILPLWAKVPRDQPTRNRELHFAIDSFEADWCAELIRCGADPCYNHLAASEPWRATNMLSEALDSAVHRGRMKQPIYFCGPTIDLLTEKCLDQGLDLGNLVKSTRRDDFCRVVIKVCSLATVKRWVEHGANPFARRADIHGGRTYTARRVAVDSGRAEIVEYFDTLKGYEDAAKLPVECFDYAARVEAWEGKKYYESEYVAELSSGTEISEDERDFSRDWSRRIALSNSADQAREAEDTEYQSRNEVKEEIKEAARRRKRGLILLPPPPPLDDQ